MATDKEENNNQDTIEPGSLGRLLVQYREIAQVDVEQAADALCLTSSAIIALENEEFDKLPEAAYIRGYLRNYAKLANKDPGHLIDVFNRLHGKPSNEEVVSKLAAPTSYHQVENPIITPQRFRLGLLTGLFLLLVLLSMLPGVRHLASGLWNNFSASPDSPADVTSDSTASLPSLTGNLPGNIPIDTENPQDESAAGAGNSETQEEDSSSTATDESKEQADQDTTDNASTDDTTADTDTPSPDESKSEEQADANNNNGEEPATADLATSDENNTENNTSEEQGDTKLKMVFKQEVWLRITDANGKKVYEALHPAGTEKELSLNRPLKFKVGNAPGLTLYVDGEMKDISSFTKGSVAKFGIE